MQAAEKITQHPDLDLLLSKVTTEVTEADVALFLSVVSTDLEDWQIEQVLTPDEVFKRQDIVLATHWHPEFVPMDMIAKRINATFPNRSDDLIIPTQHNEIMQFGKYSGVEVDCYSSGFNQKVQFLLHFENKRVEKAHVLKSMLGHTQKYRSSQLFEFIHTITSPLEDRIEEATRETGVEDKLVEFVYIHVCKIERMIDEYWDKVPTISLKNKLLRNFFDGLRPIYGETFINRVQAYLKAVKKIVKSHFSLKYFYRATEVIEETRALGGCIVIPHPEQFWPILLAGYDVDGYEVWNPQSQRYTEFLISVVNEKNRQRSQGDRKILIFMGDDTHMGEKTRRIEQQDTAKAAREIGVQPAWDDLCVRKRLITNNVSRRTTIAQYRARLAG
ncbi:hypothetical protein [Desulfoplanes sp.]